MSAIPTVLKKNPFVANDDSYQCRLYPLKGYIEQNANIIAKTFDITYDESVKFIKATVNEANIKIPEITYNGLDKNRDKVVKKTTIDKYLKDNINKGNVIVPSFTVYSNPKTRKSLHNGYVLSNLKKRTIEKNFMKEATANKDIEKASYHNVLQRVKKTFNNSLSGTYASMSTILYNPSGHYTLTTMTRAVASVGNAITEMVMMGNRHYTSTDTILSHIGALITNIDSKVINNVITKYKLSIPTPEEVLVILKYSADNYYEDKNGEKRILKLLKNLSNAELAMVAYVNDFYQLREFNPKLVRHILTGLGRPYSNNLDDTTETLDNAPGWLLDLVHMVCSDTIKGTKVNYKKLQGTVGLRTLTGTAERIIKSLDYFGDLFTAFFQTPILPIDIVDIKSLIRRAIVISDTDSTCGSYSNYSNWFFGDNRFTQDATGITGAVMVIVTQTMNHYLKQVSRNMNINKDLLDVLEMKNEFYWEVVVAPTISKHYYAGINIKEGYVFDEPELEVKGVHFMGTTMPKKYKDRVKSMQQEIVNTLSSGELVDLEGYLREVSDFEREILEELLAGKVDILKTAKIKEEDTYANGWKSSSYYHFKLWEEVFADKYGKIPNAPISTFVVNTTLTTKGKIKDFIESIEDEQLKDRLVKFYSKHEKGSLGAFQLPVEIGSEIGVPTEILKVMDTSKTITNLLRPFYMILETCGYVKKPDCTLMDLGM